ncbi:hypothetical protein ESCO_003293 [Escovopsis weberi]|uniref:SMODS and SLOG-associating 2TM effector domain-containing protein n=1 Tax=Escovopsis weberi TaxID=150374 RepID=A0A0M8N1P2_ESCWE|nr:hypothetical protein ESCO_003293 [Escovopsis weberi]
MPDEHTPLLDGFGDGSDSHRPPHEYDWSSDPHAQFCILVGCPPSLPVDDRDPRFRDLNRTVPRKSLYGRATRRLADQRLHYYTAAALSNALLLSQVVLGAALTALGASESSHVLITLFGAANTIIAGLVAYLKSRGQPMRARMFLDDLERVVGEIENSEIMWLGIAHHADGYDDIGSDEHQVTVRSEVARLTRLYDRAVRSNSASNPDMYGEPSDGASSGPRAGPPRPGQGGGLPAAPPPAGSAVMMPPTRLGLTGVAVPPPPAPGIAIEDAEPATAASAPILISSPPRHEPKREEDDGVSLMYHDGDYGVRKSSSALELSARQGDSSSSGGSSADSGDVAHSLPGNRYMPL